MSTVFINSYLQAVPPYLAGGAPMPIAVYNPMEASSLANSYLNIISPGTYDAAPGVAPTWAAGTGWTGDGTRWLSTGIVPDNNTSILIRFSSATAGAMIGANGLGAASTRLYMRHDLFFKGASLVTSGANGVMGIAETTAYRDGLSQGSLASYGGSLPFYILARNDGGTAGIMFAGNIQYVIVWNTFTGHATWMPQVSAAVAAL